MKKLKLLFSVMMVAFALLLTSAAMVAPAVQYSALTLKTAGNAVAGNLRGEVLFDTAGHYNFNRLGLVEGKTYQFFGHDWFLVWSEGDVATFWMTDPYAVSKFNTVSRSNGEGVYLNGDNVWTNGYTNTIWKDPNYTENQDVSLGQSDIRKFLNDEAKTMIDNEAYASYKDKVVAGYVAGHNTPNENGCHAVDKLGYAKESVEQVESINSETQQLTAYWNLDENDRLWLPSKSELDRWNIMNLRTVVKADTLGWSETTVSQYAWLRTANFEKSWMVLAISYMPLTDSDSPDASYFHHLRIGVQAGVRPAIHLNIKNIDEDYQAHLASLNNNNLNNNGKNGSSRNWWDDDWLKALFFTVCIIGLIGIVLVIVAVISRARHEREENN